MMGTFIIFLAAVYLLLTFAWIMKDPDIEKGFWSKSYHMLLLLFMKADLALAAGMEYAKLTLEHICRGYHRPISGAQNDMATHRRKRWGRHPPSCGPG